MTAKTALLTLIALVAFAANSVLGRAALVGEHIDPLSFSAIRLLSGALFLLPFLLVLRKKATVGLAQAPAGTLALFVYAVGFSLAYLTLTAATGALILFGAVQFTMIGAAVRRGEQPWALQWVGIAAAAGGLVWLMLPGLAAPDPQGAGLMAVSGVAWGVYSLVGRGVPHPTAATARNFVLAAPLAVTLFFLPTIPGVEVIFWTWTGGILAIMSGAITSAAGYVIWYMALRSLGSVQASVVQLSVPLITAFGGAVLIAEPVTWRLASAAILILGGIAVTVMKPRPAPV